MMATNLAREPERRLQQVRDSQRDAFRRRVRDVAASVIEQMGSLDTRSERERQVDALADAITESVYVPFKP